MNDRKVDLKFIAEKAGVSVSTVSRALSNNSMISLKTRTKIKALSAQYDFRINEAARAWKLQRTGIIGIGRLNDSDADMHNSEPFYLEMIGKVADALGANNYNLLISPKSFESVAGFLTSRVRQQVDGFIFVGQGMRHPELNQIYNAGIPIIVWGADLEDRQYNIVGTDNKLGGYLATQHLLDRGKRRIAFFGLPDNSESHLRFEGYQDALCRFPVDGAPLESVIVPVSFKQDKAEQVIADFLSESIDIDGVVCASDVIAMITLKNLQKMPHPKRVPQDVAVVGFDDVLLASMTSPALTTISQNTDVGATFLVSRLLQLLEKGSIEDEVIEPKLVIRQSS
ncbi:LacI family DNA-binding transcriptional regulator [Paraglaciecola sp.]|uniref:LacI family DNA-binding transcriptional regulator n=1 Tax=Paraglaciecola sp. TaxID=1920173 RepID=UPI0030F42C8B